MVIIMKIASFIIATAVFATFSGGVHAQNTFPTKPINLMVPYPAGGLSDIIARVVNTPLAAKLGQPVVVENLGGVSGALGAQKVLDAPADGHYLLQGSANELVLAPLALKAVKLKTEDFRMVQMIATAPMVIVARKDLPANTADELVALIRKSAQEGKPITYASVGVGSLFHLAGEQLSKLVNAPMTHVPYKGAADVVRDMVGQQVDLFITPNGKAAVEMAKQGRFKFIAAVSPARQAAIPHVPSVTESVALKSFVFDNTWTAYFVKKDTPEAIVQILHKALSETLSDPNVKTTLEAQSLDVAKPLSLDEAAKAYIAGAEQFRTLAKSINLAPQ
jgi:tripartite-type tricarboxylate transporter receptor subunit TctC